MKELEKTRRISIASVLFILAVIIGLLTYKRPKHLYTENTINTLKNITNPNFFISLNDVNSSHILIDIRSQFEYEKGHLENAINIYAPEILTDDNTQVFNDLNTSNKTAILYGNNPNEVIAPYMLLYQLGYKNIKILTIENKYSQNKLITQNIDLEKSKYDINSFIKESQKKITKKTIQSNPIKAPKKVLTIKKKRKMPVEGGC